MSGETERGEPEPRGGLDLGELERGGLERWPRGEAASGAVRELRSAGMARGAPGGALWSVCYKRGSFTVHCYSHKETVCCSATWGMNTANAWLTYTREQCHKMILLVCWVNCPLVHLPDRARRISLQRGRFTRVQPGEVSLVPVSVSSLHSTHAVPSCVERGQISNVCSWCVGSDTV